MCFEWIRFPPLPPKYRKKCLKKHTYEFVKGVIEKEGYKLLSKEYNNNQTKLELECDKGHIYKVRYNNFQKGHRCPECYFEKIKYDYEFIKGEIEKEGYKLLSNKYKNNNTKLELECPEGHIYEVKYGKFQQGRRCPECCNSKSFSKGEKDVLKYIQSLTTNIIIENDRTQIINPKTGWNLELDIFLPRINKAIEYNSTYWHSSEKAIYNDLQKVIQCKEKGIDLMIIEEKDWNDNKYNTKQQISNWINII